MSNAPVLLAALAAGDGVRITSVDGVPGNVCNVEMQRIVDGRKAGSAIFRYHTGTTPWEIGAVLSQQIMAASGADSRFTPHVLADWSAREYRGGSAEAVRLLQGLLGSRYELYMETCLDAALASGNRLAAVMMEMERREVQAKPLATAGSSGCLVLLVSTAVGGLITAVAGSALINRTRRR
ncbi:hypothetical protein ACFXHA_03405 [Nocardia sp. NPDC059240]|uniref:hypothetical protein n=1 Tax=Nocardia sp. NPDC059240 TaxID=3346786 RepID=UPI00367D50D4